MAAAAVGAGIAGRCLLGRPGHALRGAGRHRGLRPGVRAWFAGGRARPGASSRHRPRVAGPAPLTDGSAAAGPGRQADRDRPGARQRDRGAAPPGRRRALGGRPGRAGRDVRRAARPARRCGPRPAAGPPGAARSTAGRTAARAAAPRRRAGPASRTAGAASARAGWWCWSTCRARCPRTPTPCSGWRTSASRRCDPRRIEVFTIGTRLTRVTRALRIRDPDAALRAAGEQVAGLVRRHPAGRGAAGVPRPLGAARRGPRRGRGRCAPTAGSAATPRCSPSRWPGCAGWRTASSG